MAQREFRILTYNILHDIPQYRELDQRLELIAAAIAAQRPHVAALQEVARAPGCGDISARLAKLVNRFCGAALYGVHYEPADGAGEADYAFDEGLALIIPLGSNGNRPAVLKYEAQVEIATHFAGHHYRLPDGRIAIRMRYRIADGAEVDVYTTHLTDRAERKEGVPIRLIQARELLGWIQSVGDGERPVIVAGDLNDTPGSETLRCFTEAGFIDLYAAAGTGNGYTNDLNDIDLESPVASHNQRIDYLLFRPGRARRFEIAETRLFLDRPHPRPDGRWLWPSDHIGVIAKLRL